MTRLAEYLRDNGVSIYRLAQITGIDKRTIAALARGECHGQMWTWLEICRALGCTLDDVKEV